MTAFLEVSGFRDIKAEFNVMSVFSRELTKMPHMATTAGDEQTVELMLKRWQDPESGLDHAWQEDYMVYLSFPDPKNPNKVTVGEYARLELKMGEYYHDTRCP